VQKEASKSLHAAHWKTYAGTTTSAPGCINLSLGRLGFTSTTLSAATTHLRPHALYVDLAMRRNYSSPAARALRRPRHAPRLLVSGRTRSTSTSPCAATTRLRPHALYVDLAVRRDYSSPAARALCRPRRAPRVLVSTPPAAAIYFASAVCPGASARRAARHAALRATHRRLLRAHCRLLRLRRVFGCLGTSRGSSRGSSRRSSSTTPGSSSTTSPTPRVWVPRHIARLIARRRLLRLRRASGCLGTSRGPSRGSSSTTPCAATSSCGHSGSTSATLCVATTCLAATLAQLRVCRAPPRRRLPVTHRVDHSSPN
jgi:hypothetical protein